MTLSPGSRSYISAKHDRSTPGDPAIGGEPTEIVAIVYHFFAHYRGGVVEELLKSQRYRFIFYGETDDPHKAGIKPHAFSDPSRLIRTKAFPVFDPFLWQFGLIRLALRRDVRTIIYLGTPWFVATWLSAILARLLGKRVLFWSQGWYVKDAGWRLALKNSFYGIGHGVLVYEHASKALGIASGFAPESIYVVHNSLNYRDQVRARDSVTRAELDELKQKCFGDSSAQVVVYVGRLIPSKQVSMLVEAVRQLGEQHHAVNLLIVGDGPERVALEKSAKAYGLHAHFYGPCYDENVIARLMMMSDVMASPGNVGLNAIHSLTYGTPIVTHDNVELQGPEVEAIWPGVTGDLFRHNDTADLARAICKWTSRTASDEVRGQSRALIERFYTPMFQRQVIERAVSGAPANDLFWLERQPGQAAATTVDGTQNRDTKS